MQTATVQPFHLTLSSRHSGVGGVLSFLGPMIERLLAFPSLNAVYAGAISKSAEKAFSESVLETLNVRVDVETGGLDRIPVRGPLVVVANHPIGGIEGLVLAALLQRVRPDVRLLANYLLHCIPEMRDISIFVDPFGGSGAQSRNLGPMRKAIRLLRDGGCLAVFPAGEVAHFDWRSRCITDSPWNSTIGRLVHAGRAAVLPIFFGARNRLRFQVLGMLHPRLRTLMLPRELLHKRFGTIPVQVGGVIPYHRLAPIQNDTELTEYLRLRTFILKGRSEKSGAVANAKLPKNPQNHGGASIVEPLHVDEVRAEIESLPPEDLLLSSGAFRVYGSPAGRIPKLLHEIGRLREVTFREVGEGTGRHIDLDRFDPHYLHLFIWQAERGELVGAYRMAPTDELTRRFGVKGLYTHTLFDYEPVLLERMGPALELGRSFVVSQYQRSHSPLMLLWKGIGRYVAQHPQYRMLFGAVSISDEYHSMTKQLLMAFLRASDYQCDLSSLVSPRHPPRVKRFRDCDAGSLKSVVRDLDQVDEMVREIEGNGKEMPVLLRQYLKLNGKLLGFNRDPDFGDVLDGLMLVDLTKVDRTVLRRYLGKENVETFLEFHGAAAPSD